jgi:hypothetical protein
VKLSKTVCKRCINSRRFTHTLRPGIRLRDDIDLKKDMIVVSIPWQDHEDACNWRNGMVACPITDKARGGYATLVKDTAIEHCPFALEHLMKTT